MQDDEIFNHTKLMQRPIIINNKIGIIGIIWKFNQSI
jgi:hypothetical protein